MTWIIKQTTNSATSIFQVHNWLRRKACQKNNQQKQICVENKIWGEETDSAENCRNASSLRPPAGPTFPHHLHRHSHHHRAPHEQESPGHPQAEDSAGWRPRHQAQVCVEIQAETGGGEGVRGRGNNFSHWNENANFPSKFLLKTSTFLRNFCSKHLFFSVISANYWPLVRGISLGGGPRAAPGEDPRLPSSPQILSSQRLAQQLGRGREVTGALLLDSKFKTSTEVFPP